MAQIMGNLTADAIVKPVNDQHVVEFTVAENYEYKNKKGEKIKKTCYFNCFYWNHENLAPYLKKGVGVIITGFMEPQGYLNKQHEIKAQIKLTVTGLDWPPSSPNKETTTKKKGKGATTEESITESVGDLPF